MGLKIVQFWRGGELVGDVEGKPGDSAFEKALDLAREAFPGCEEVETEPIEEATGQGRR